jgi:RNA-directed DNA polymerase
VNPACLLIGNCWVSSQRLDDGSRMSGDVHVRFCERLGVRLPRATHRNVYVRSRRAGERVMVALERMYAKLRLRVNREKSKLELAHKCSLLSYSFWYAKGGTVMCRVAPKATRALKQRVREITRRSGGRSLSAVVAELRKYLPGWKEYFQLADTPRVFADHDKWIRHRLRALQPKQWRRGPKVYAELRKLGVEEDAAAKVAANARRWWRNSAMLVQLGLNTRYYDRMGVPKLAR